MKVGKLPTFIRYIQRICRCEAISSIRTVQLPVDETSRHTTYYVQ